jgi:tellurite resistance protein
MPMSKVEMLRAACCVAGLDGRVGNRERALLERIAREVGAGQASLEAMIHRAKTDSRFYEELFNGLTANAEPTIRLLLMVAAADRVISADERIIIGLFAQRLGMSHERYNQLVDAMEMKIAASDPQPQ